MTQVMLNHVKVMCHLSVIFISGCINRQNATSIKETSMGVIGKDSYYQVYRQAKDSINCWVINGLGYHKFFGESKNYFLDSCLCFNSKKNRFIGTILKQQLLKEGVADDIDYFFGEKIDNKWFFFSGMNIFIPREMVKGQNVHKPLSYQQLHEIALKEVFSAYLTKDGEINDNWFAEQFEGVQWGSMDEQEYLDWCFKGKRYTNKVEFYKAAHLCKVKANWMQRDTTQPIKQLPAKKHPIP